MSKNLTPKFTPDQNAPENDKFIATHQEYLSKEEKIDPKSIEIGDVIKFMYDGDERIVYVLNPEHGLKLHGLSMKQINRNMLMTEVISKLMLHKDPFDFYNKVIKQHTIQKTDSYRTYNIRKMTHIHRVKYDLDERKLPVVSRVIHDAIVDAFAEKNNG